MGISREPSGFKPRPEDGILRRVPGSTATYSVTQLGDRFIAPVWHPGDHPPLPQIVAEGRKPNVFACGFCHRADGQVDRRTPVLRAFPRLISSNKWPITRAASRTTSVPKETLT